MNGYRGTQRSLNSSISDSSEPPTGRDVNVHERSSKVQSIANEISALEDRYNWLSGRHEWLFNRLMKQKLNFIDQNMMSNAKTRKTHFFSCWKEALKELRYENQLEQQAAALERCKEVTNSLSKVLAQEQTRRQAAEADSRQKLAEAGQVLQNCEGLQSEVDAQTSRIQVLTRRLAEADGIISKSHQSAISLVQKLETYEHRRMERTRAANARKVSDLDGDAMVKSRRVRDAAHGTMNEVSRILPGKNGKDTSPKRLGGVSPPISSGQGLTPTRAGQTIAPPQQSAVKEELQRLQHQQRVQQQLNQIENEQLERQRQDYIRTGPRQKAYQEPAPVEPQQEMVQVQNQIQYQQMEQLKLRQQEKELEISAQVVPQRREVISPSSRGRASSSSNAFQASPMRNRSVSSDARGMRGAVGSQRMLISTGPAIMPLQKPQMVPQQQQQQMYTMSGPVMPSTFPGQEPWWYSQ
eukprot:TRINITY_DN96591_c0_g1_i1.p1 TRINITY_DN96591_c0_g1~~TRINITY_DN96591_c0_g1_i1.p1  ORF type:complete len:467 (+),score=98.93 TRINITY_DN96591_c0_g1_i1:104-1504(+)